ncbi:MAG: hypothetical protein ACJ71Z_13595 [Aeromicrobium sp.]
MDSSSHKVRNVLTYGLIAVLAIAATLFGLSNGRILGVTPTSTPTATPTVATPNPVDAQPAPDLFKAVDLLPVRLLLAPQALRARTNIDDFYDGQPTGGAVDDAAFTKWAARQITSKPSAAARSYEKTLQLKTLKLSGKKDSAAGWLRLHGCSDVWTSFAIEQKRFHAADAPVTKRTDLTALLNLAASVTAAAHQRFAAEGSATAAKPCVPRTASTGDESFPSAAAAMSAAARTYLEALQPLAGRQYGWMEQQVDTAAVYQGFEIPSDVRAGAYLGYLTGRYFVASRGYPVATPTPTPTAATR